MSIYGALLPTETFKFQQMDEHMTSHLMALRIKVTPMSATGGHYSENKTSRQSHVRHRSATGRALGLPLVIKLTTLIKLFWHFELRNQINCLIWSMAVRGGEGAYVGKGAREGPPQSSDITSFASMQVPHHIDSGFVKQTKIACFVSSQRLGWQRRALAFCVVTAGLVDWVSTRLLPPLNTLGSTTKVTYRQTGSFIWNCWFCNVCRELLFVCKIRFKPSTTCVLQSIRLRYHPENVHNNKISLSLFPSLL